MELKITLILGKGKRLFFFNFIVYTTIQIKHFSPLSPSPECQPWISRDVCSRDGDQESPPPAVPHRGVPAGQGSRGHRGVLQPEQDQSQQLH